jgi:hypothetical protein
MATEQVAPAAVTGQLQFYTTPEPLSRDAHGGLAVQQLERPFGFAEKGHVVPLTVAEFGFAAVSYPIIFGGTAYMPLAARTCS